MKKTLVYLVFVLMLLIGCSPDPDFSMDPFDEAACYTVDGGLTNGTTLKANTDPYFLDDKNIDALMKDPAGVQTIETKVRVILVTGDKDGASKTQAFATIENYYAEEAVIELYMNKTVDVVDSLLTGQTYDGVTLTDDIETDYVAYFDSNAVPAAEQNFTISDEITKFNFVKEATRTVYGKTASIPTLGLREKPYNVTCEAVEIMSLYSYLEVEEADSVIFYFNNYMSMRIWDADGNRIPMADNSISLEMAAQFGNRADNSKGAVLSKCVYVLDAGTYYVRWIRAEATKSSAQFATDPESETNYFKFRVGIFPSTYEKDAETVDIASKLENPTIMKEARSAAQCDSTFWAADYKLAVTELLRSGDKMNALLNGLDSISVADLDQGIKMSYDQTLPQGIFFLEMRSMEDVDTLRMYVDGGTFTFYKLTAEYASGGKKFDPFTPSVIGTTFKEAFVSDSINDVIYLYNFSETLYIVTFVYDGASDGINMVIKGN